LVGVATGDPASAATQSGVAVGVFDALERRGVLCARVDASMRGATKALCAASCGDGSGEGWRHRLHRGAGATAARPRRLNRQVGALPPFDAVLLVRNVYRPV